MTYDCPLLVTRLGSFYEDYGPESLIQLVSWGGGHKHPTTCQFKHWYSTFKVGGQVWSTESYFKNREVRVMFQTFQDHLASLSELKSETSKRETVWFEQLGFFISVPMTKALIFIVAWITKQLSEVQTPHPALFAVVLLYIQNLHPLNLQESQAGLCSLQTATDMLPPTWLTQGNNLKG